MDLENEIDRFFVAKLISELRFVKRCSWDVSYQSLLYLNLIRYCGGSTVGRLADILDIDKSTASRKVDALVRDGMVSKVRDGSDGRVHRLELTPEWSRMYDDDDVPYDRAVARMLSEFSEEEVSTVCRAMRIMTEELEKG